MQQEVEKTEPPVLDKAESTLGEKASKEEELLELTFRAMEEKFKEEMGLVEKPKEDS